MTGKIRELARPDHLLDPIRLVVVVGIAWPEGDVTGLATGDGGW